jgi:hypothetical protein
MVSLLFSNLAQSVICFVADISETKPIEFLLSTNYDTATKCQRIRATSVYSTGFPNLWREKI